MKKLNSESVNITAKTLLTQAVALLVEADATGRYPVEARNVKARTAQAYIKAAEAMHKTGVDYIDLGDRGVR